MEGSASLYPGSANSLPEVHGSVATQHSSFWRRMFAFAGPAYLVSVGYMDPGNWASDLEGGARFGYQLLWVLVVSNLMAVLLQTLSARLGIVSQRDLAQACRESYPRLVSYSLWVLCEIAIAACDLAEVLGAAIALNLLFHIPLLIGVAVTSADTLLLLWMNRFGIRMIERVILLLIASIAMCFAAEIWMAGGLHLAPLLNGLVPRLNDKTLFVAIAILGATVMPHNLYLHSALVQTRRIGTTEAEKRTACKYNLLDSAIALNGALFVNAAILILASLVFFQRNIIVTEIQQAHLLLAPLLGTSVASLLFGIALLCSGQSSTLTGTMAGQIVMEGFLNFRMRPWLRRLITRSVAIIPAALTIYFAGEKSTYALLLLSQVVLSLQLPFATIPLIQFTNSKERMGTFANARWVKVLSWTTAAVIVSLNVRLVWQAVGEWLQGPHGLLLGLLLTPVLTALTILLLWMIFAPHVQALRPKAVVTPIQLPERVATELNLPDYQKILVPLDHTNRDRAAVEHAAGMARRTGAILYLLHVEEGVTSQVYGALASTAEVEAGLKYLRDIADNLRSQGVQVEAVVRHGRSPRNAIVAFAQELQPDLVVMGAHGHKGLKDLIFGTTINAVRHELKIPMLVVR